MGCVADHLPNLVLVAHVLLLGPQGIHIHYILAITAKLLAVGVSFIFRVVAVVAVVVACLFRTRHHTVQSELNALHKTNHRRLLLHHSFSLLITGIVQASFEF